MNKSEFDVVIVDSGVGALSIYREIRQRYPKANLLVAMDDRNHPYGTKNDCEVLELVSEFVGELQAKFYCRLVVIACNTASTLALDHLRKKFDCPFVGVVPAIKPAAESDPDGKIALLATEATIRRKYTQKLIEEFAGGREVVLVGTRHLVSFAEAKVRGAVLDERGLVNDLQPIVLDEAISTVVLGCTHFPLIQKEIERCIGRRLNWIDSSEAIARRIGQLRPAMENQGKNLVVGREMDELSFNGNLERFLG